MPEHTPYKPQPPFVGGAIFDQHPVMRGHLCPHCGNTYQPPDADHTLRQERDALRRQVDAFRTALATHTAELERVLAYNSSIAQVVGQITRGLSEAVLFSDPREVA